ncbi:hypothetical protein L1987_03483 [Smallanthus sonchifolius]|uniref:Uncharacterized protein n=1 Tax=Smallanthus sonchifolius TaxID=185202 RepID=A0ACB9KAT2_9ASTR|nr:hypothetical protein L1987_03483 [Smallanthus sonchifolius]
MPWFERFLEEAKKVAYPCLEEKEAESSSAAQERAVQRLGLMRSNVLTEDQILSLRRYLYNEAVRGLEIYGWSNTDPSGIKFLLCDVSSIEINKIQEVLLLNPDFLLKVFLLRSQIYSINSPRSQEMILLIKSFLQDGVWIALDASPNSSKSSSPPPQGDLNARISMTQVIEAWDLVPSDEEKVAPPLPILQISNEAYAEVSITTSSSSIVVNEAEAEASNQDKGKGIMTDEIERMIEEEKRER